MVREDISQDKNPHWKGGIHVRLDGYIIVRLGTIPKSAKGARYALLHRLLMEEKLGRKLLRSEIVHHKDGNNKNNALENLEIMTQVEHARLHLKEKGRRDKKTGRII